MKRKFPGNTRRYSPRTALATVGLKVNSLKLLGPVKQKVVILQKSVRHTPSQKLTDAFTPRQFMCRGVSHLFRRDF